MRVSLSANEIFSRPSLERSAVIKINRLEVILLQFMMNRTKSKSRPDRWNKTQFFPSNGPILLYGCTTLTKQLEKKLDGNYTRMLRPILNRSSRQHPTSTNYTATCLPLRKTIQVRTNQTGRTLLEKQGRAHKWCTPMDPSYGRAKAGRPTRTYIQQLCEDTGCSPEDQPEAMNGREKWRERVRDIRASGTTWWWCWW